MVGYSKLAKKNQKSSESQSLPSCVLSEKKHTSKIPNSHCPASALAAIVSCRRRLIARLDRSAVPPPIVLPLLPFIAATVRCDHAATDNHDCHCRPSRVDSNCAASALVAIVRRPSAIHPPVAHCNCFAIPLPIAPLLLPIAARAALRVSYSQRCPLRV